MQVIDPTKVEPKDMGAEGAYRVTMRVLVGPDQGAPNFVMRLFEVAEGGHTPMHAHDWEHGVFVLEGEGEVVAPEDRRLPLLPQTAAYVAPGEMHQFVNIGQGPLRFLCIIPAQPQPC